MSTPIKEFMTRNPHTIDHDMSIKKAVEMMAEHSCHHLPVLNGGRLVGVLSDRDIRSVKKLPEGEKLLVGEIMSEDPVIVAPTEDIFQVAMLMHQKNIGSVVVSTDGDAPWGIFTATDALAYFSERPPPQPTL